MSERRASSPTWGLLRGGFGGAIGATIGAICFVKTGDLSMGALVGGGIGGFLMMVGKVMRNEAAKVPRGFGRLLARAIGTIF